MKEKVKLEDEYKILKKQFKDLETEN